MALEILTENVRRNYMKKKGNVKKEIQELLKKSRSLKTVIWRKESDTSKNKFLYDFYRYWRWLQTEGVKEFEWLKDIKTPDDLIKHYDSLPAGKEKYMHVDPIEFWLKSLHRIGSNTKRSMLTSIRCFYKENRSPLPKSEVKFRKTQLEKQRIQTQCPIQLSELRSLIMRGNVLERAVLLCCFQGAMGVGEFEEFNVWNKDLAKRLKEGEVPLLINLHRPKTDEVYYSFLEKDAVEALKLWLKERERLTGKPIEFGEPIFISLDKKRSSKEKKVFTAVKSWTIQRIVRTLSAEVGLEKPEKFDQEKYSAPSQIRHKFHPHELRDVFKSVCSIAGVNPIASEWFLGHKIDKLGYDKSPFIDKEFFRKEYKKAAGLLNLLSSAGAPEETKVQRDRIVVLEDMVRELQENLKEMERAVGFFKGGKFDEMFFPNLANGVYEVRTAKNEAELDELLGEGFEVVLQMPDGRWKLRRKKS